MDSEIKECILCHSKHISVKAEIKSHTVNSIYFESFGYDFSNFFPEEQFKFYNCKNCNLQFFSPIMAGNEAFYNILQELRDNYYSKIRPEFSTIKNYIKSGDKVLDVGAGQGDFATMLNYANYTGLEFSPSAIENAKKNNIFILRESIEHHSILYNNKYNVVLSNHVHEHVPDLYSFISAGVRALIKGGYYILSVPNNENSETSSVNHTLNLPPHHISRFTKSSLSNLTSFGLELIAIKSVGKSNSRNSRIRLVNNILIKKIVILSGSNGLVTSVSRMKRLQKIINKIPPYLKLLIYKIFVIHKGLNYVAIYRKL